MCEKRDRLWPGVASGWVAAVALCVLLGAVDTARAQCSALHRVMLPDREIVVVELASQTPDLPVSSRRICFGPECSKAPFVPANAPRSVEVKVPREMWLPWITIELRDSSECIPQVVAVFWAEALPDGVFRPPRARA